MQEWAIRVLPAIALVVACSSERPDRARACGPGPCRLQVSGQGHPVGPTVALSAGRVHLAWAEYARDEVGPRLRYRALEEGVLGPVVELSDGLVEVEGERYYHSLSAGLDGAHVVARTSCDPSLWQGCGGQLEVEELTVDPNLGLTRRPLDPALSVGALSKGLIASATGSDGAVHACYRVRHPDPTGDDVAVAWRAAADESWSAQLRHASELAPADQQHCDVTTSPVDGTTRVAWQDGRGGGGGSIVLELDDGRTAAAPPRVELALAQRHRNYARVAVGPDGAPHLVWQEEPEGGGLWEVWHAGCEPELDCELADSWSIERVSEAGLEALHPFVAVTADGMVAALFEQDGGVTLATRCPGEEWSRSAVGDPEKHRVLGLNGRTVAADPEEPLVWVVYGQEEPGGLRMFFEGVPLSGCG